MCNALQLILCALDLKLHFLLSIDSTVFCTGHWICNVYSLFCVLCIFFSVFVVLYPLIMGIITLVDKILYVVYFFQPCIVLYPLLLGLIHWCLRGGTHKQTFILFIRGAAREKHKRQTHPKRINHESKNIHENNDRSI